MFVLILALIMILYDRMFAPYIRQLANKTITVEKSKLNLLVSGSQAVDNSVIPHLFFDRAYRQES